LEVQKNILKIILAAYQSVSFYITELLPPWKQHFIRQVVIFNFSLVTGQVEGASPMIDLTWLALCHANSWSTLEHQKTFKERLKKLM